MQRQSSIPQRSMPHSCARRWRGRIVGVRAFAVLAAVLGLALVSPYRAAAQIPVPFRATYTEDVVAHLCPFPTLCFSISGSGQATHLGTTSEVSSASIDLLTIILTGCSPESRTATLAAANGDELYLSLSGTTCGDAQSGSSTYTYVIVGGTGRFSGATGSGIATSSYSSSGSTTSLSGSLIFARGTGD
jgi:hypothetical protein